MKKKLSKFNTDDEAEEFLADADLSEYDLSDFRTVQFQFEKTEQIGSKAAAKPGRTGASRGCSS